MRLDWDDRLTSLTGWGGRDSVVSFLPLTFLTGFFGQNFAWLVEHTDSLVAFLVLGLAGQLLAILVLFTWLRRGGHVRPLA